MSHTRDVRATAEAANFLKRFLAFHTAVFFGARQRVFLPLESEETLLGFAAPSHGTSLACPPQCWEGLGDEHWSRSQRPLCRVPGTALGSDMHL